MINMDGTTGPAGGVAAPVELPWWKVWTSSVSAVLLALLFLVSGIWKITDPIGASVRMAQALVPPALSLPAALGFGISEAVAGVFLLTPRFRRWGAWLAGLLLVAFMLYMGVFYGALRGEDCNCFPWIRRVVGPAFFIGDGIMLLMAVAAGLWAQPSHGLRSAAVMAGAVCVFAAASYGITEARRSLIIAPESVIVDGSRFPLREGRVFLFFFNPECLHCLDAARELGKLDWGETRVIGVVTQQPEFGAQFLHSARLRARLSSDVEPLKAAFSFADVPYAVALEHGRQRAAFSSFDAAKVIRTLRSLGFAR